MSAMQGRRARLAPPMPRPGEMDGKNRPSAPKLIPRLVGAVVKAAPISAAGLTAAALGDGFVAAGQLMVTQGLIDTLRAALAGEAVRAGALDGPVGAVVPWLIGLAAVMVLGILLEMLRSYCEVDVQEKVGIQLQREVIEKAHAVELVHFEHPDFYDMLQRANQDMGSRLVTLLRLVTDMVASVAGMTGILVVLWQAHWSLAPITVLGVAPGFWVMLRMRKRTYWVYRIRTPESRLAIYLNNLMTRREEAKEIRLFTLAKHLHERWVSLSKALHVERRQLEVKQAWLGLLTDGVRTASYAGCLALLATMVAGARITFGAYAVIMQALQQFSARIEQMMRNVSGLHEQSLYLADLYEFLAVDAPGTKEPETSRPMANDPAEAQGKIELRDVRFTYPGGERPVLEGINLVIHPGERIALIGENGAGKSTLIRLIMGLYAPTQGEVLVDGKRIDAMPEPELRRYFAAVFQEFVHYQFPVIDNIRFGRLEDATLDDVVRAAKLSGAAEFIEQLPDGYDTMLGRPLGGVDLSGGQWQKLAIARALVRRAPVVVLDEPTAALDPKAEAEIYEQFGEMTVGRTSILISHRLGSARMADRIVVLKGGRIVEIGSHEELLRRDGEYARMFNLQAQWYQ